MFDYSATSLSPTDSRPWPVKVIYAQPPCYRVVAKYSKLRKLRQLSPIYSILFHNDPPPATQPNTTRQLSSGLISRCHAHAGSQPPASPARTPTQTEEMLCAAVPLRHQFPPPNVPAALPAPDGEHQTRKRSRTPSKTPAGFGLSSGCLEKHRCGCSTCA